MMKAAASTSANYGRGWGGAYASIMGVAREFGDNEMARRPSIAWTWTAAAARTGASWRYGKMSNLSNTTAVIGRIRRRGDFRAAVVEGPPASVFTGPLLTGASYPEVLVARAFSKGEDLDLVLFNGAAAGAPDHRPGAAAAESGLSGSGRTGRRLHRRRRRERHTDGASRRAARRCTSPPPPDSSGAIIAASCAIVRGRPAGSGRPNAAYR